MEHDHIGHTTTANLATHTRTHTPRGRKPIIEEAKTVIVITPPRASDSDFTNDYPNRASPQTAPEPTSAYANNWPHAPRTDSSGF